MEQQTTPTAAQHALATPEIVANIFKHLTQERWIASFFGGPKIFYDRKWLHPCSLVNSLWCAEAMRYLWEYPTTGRIISLDECLARVHPDHRQFYASFVRRAKVTSAHPADFSQRSTIMSDLAFPRLRCLALCIEESRDQTLLSWPHAPNVEELFIQPILQIYPGGQVENFNNWGKTLPERTLINLPEHIKVCPSSVVLLLRGVCAF